MTVQSERQFIRRASLIVTAGDKGLDLSNLKFDFSVMSADYQSPNHARIRVFNLAPDTMKKIQGEYQQVVLQAGYEGASFGIIFQGTIKQFRLGRLSAIDTFLEILAGDSDIGYNFGVVNKTFAKGSTLNDMMKEASLQMGAKLVEFPNVSNPSLIRGRVGFGMARDMARQVSDTVGSTWSIQQGEVQVIPLTKYLPGDIVEINSLTGMIGIPELTDEGVRVRTLLNPRLRIGARVRLNNKDITQLDIKSIVPFNVRVGKLFQAPLANAADGLYRVYTLDHSGDTRGNEWYSDMVCLAIAPSASGGAGAVQAYGEPPT